MGVGRKKIPEVDGQPADTRTPGTPTRTPTPTTASANDQLLQINTNMETLFAKSNQLMIDSMKNLQVNMDAKLENTKEEMKNDLKKSEEVQRGHMNDMQKKTEGNMQKEIENLAGRLENLEKNSELSKRSPRPRMPASPPHSQGEDPWHAREGLKDYRPKHKDPWARSSPSPTASSPFTPKKKNPLSDADFVPNAIFVKGWGQYGSHRGLPMGEAQALGLQLKNKLSPTLQGMIASIQAPYLMNHRIMIKMKNPGEDCWTVRNALADELKARPIKAMGKDIYVIVEPGPNAKKRTQVTARARAALMKQVEDEKDAQVDYRAGHIYWSSDLILIGKIMKKDDEMA